MTVHDDVDMGIRRFTTTANALLIFILIRVPICHTDLNPLENAWDYLDRAVRAVVPISRTQVELFAALILARDAILVSNCAELVTSMPRRMEAVKKTGDIRE